MRRLLVEWRCLLVMGLALLWKGKTQSINGFCVETRVLLRSTRVLQTTKKLFSASSHGSSSSLRKILSSSIRMESKDSSTSCCKRAQKISLDNLDQCGKRLREGGLVAFPTETVYGLGANAMNERACRSIFAAKERPLTDPLIVHVTTNEEALSLWNAENGSTERHLLENLCSAFWPGPLTLVAKAGSKVPLVVMAGTGFVACRNPNHAIARAIIDAAGVPIAAPSANKFGHVSPTTAEHVWDDLHEEDVWIIESDESHEMEDQRKIMSCHVGVESSVVKLEMLQNNKAQLTMLRQGAISVEQLERFIEKSEIDNDSVEVLSNFKEVTFHNEATVSPGQSIRHYSPNVPSCLASDKCRSMPIGILSKLELEILKSTVIVDYGKSMLPWKNFALQYRDLSESCNSSEAAQHVFHTLRWAEHVPGVSLILLPDLSPPHKNDALALAVKDRLTRAASGKVVQCLVESQTKR